MTGSAQILRSDARNLPIADSTVDLVVTSPPYFALRSYKDGAEHYAEQIGSESTPAEFVQALLQVTAECVRVLKPSGSIWVNLGDTYCGTGDKNGLVDPKYSNGRNGQNTAKNRKIEGIRRKSLIGIPWRYALACIDNLGLILRAEVIWNKPNGMPAPGGVKDRAARRHEQWFQFAVSERYYANLDVLPSSVWTIPTEPLQVDPALGVDHFAAFPTEWPRRIILGWSPEGGTVLDPFGGTGTTAAVAKALGRHGIHNDMSADYNRLADWRINGAGFDRVWAKVHNTEFVKRDDTQLALFDDTAA